MDWFLIAFVSAFVIVTIVLCVMCSGSHKVTRHERLIIYHHDGYEIEPAEVAQRRRRDQKGGSHA